MNPIGQLVFAVVVCGYVARGAARLGYSGSAWFFASFCGSGLMAIVLLGGLPDRALEVRRASERKLLSSQLNGRRLASVRSETLHCDAAISDSATLLDAD